MTRSGQLLVAAVLALVSIASATAQSAAPATRSASVGMEILKGAWVRPDGGYTITIKGVAPDGQLEAMYANPNPLPFSKSKASLEGKVIRASFELQAGGYNGSTYDLIYDAATDRLKGTYYQAVARQKFDVVFARK